MFKVYKFQITFRYIHKCSNMFKVYKFQITFRYIHKCYNMFKVYISFRLLSDIFTNVLTCSKCIFRLLSDIFTNVLTCSKCIFRLLSDIFRCMFQIGSVADRFQTMQNIWKLRLRNFDLWLSTVAMSLIPIPRPLDISRPI